MRNVHWRRAVRSAEVAGYPARRVDALLELAMVVGSGQKRFAAAQEVIALADAAIAGLGDPPSLRVQLRFAEAELLMARDRGSAAREIYEELLEADLRPVGRDVVLARLALCGGRGNGKAAETYREALVIAEERFGPNHPRVAEILVGLANPLMVVGEYDEAQTALTRAQAIREQAFGADSKWVAEVRARFGVLAIRRDDHDTAIEELTAVLARYEADPDMVEFDRAGVLSNLAIIYSRQGDQARARRMHLRALEAMERTDPDHPRRVIPAMNVAMTYQREADTEGAVEWLDKASQIAAQRPEGYDLAVRLQLDAAEQLAADGDAAAMRHHLRRAIEYDDRLAAGKPSGRASTSRWKLARSLTEAGRHGDAKALLEQAHADVRQIDEDRSPLLAARVQLALAQSLSREGGDVPRARRLVGAAAAAVKLVEGAPVARSKKHTDAEFADKKAERRAALAELRRGLDDWREEHGQKAVVP